MKSNVIFRPSIPPTISHILLGLARLARVMPPRRFLPQTCSSPRLTSTEYMTPVRRALRSQIRDFYSLSDGSQSSI